MPAVGTKYVLIDHITLRVMNEEMDFANGKDVTLPSGQLAEVAMSVANDIVLKLDGGKYSGKFVVVSKEDLEYDWIEE